MSSQASDPARRILEDGWVPDPGYTMPNRRRYHWQWLWDSSFHAIAWSGLGDQRAVTELETLFSLQEKSGFLPHMGYHGKPWASLTQWRSFGHSDITQPPMYGHALRVLDSRGFNVSHLIKPATDALLYLFRERLDPATGLLRIVHPWESGADDSPRWDHWHHGKFHRQLWNIRKYRMVRSLVVDHGAAVANPKFEVAPASFNALVAFNARELGEMTHNQELLDLADKLVTNIEKTWSPAKRTWVDVAPKTGAVTSDVETLDSLLPILVSKDKAHVKAAFDALFDDREFWRPFGPSGVAASEPTYEPGRYWRGSAWPQLIYLLWIGATRLGLSREADLLAAALDMGVTVSGHAEHWNPETGQGQGAIPQGWAALGHEVEGAAQHIGQPPVDPSMTPLRWRMWNYRHDGSARSAPGPPAPNAVAGNGRGALSH